MKCIVNLYQKGAITMPKYVICAIDKKNPIPIEIDGEISVFSDLADAAIHKRHYYNLLGKDRELGIYNITDERLVKWEDQFQQ